jgi:hypothetical protein
MTKTTILEADVLEFDFSNFKARDFRDLVRSQREGDIDTTAQMYAKIIVACPSAWGDPKDVETYLNLNFATFNRISPSMSEAIKEDSKK